MDEPQCFCDGNGDVLAAAVAVRDVRIARLEAALLGRSGFPKNLAWQGRKSYE